MNIIIRNNNYGKFKLDVQLNDKIETIKAYLQVLTSVPIKEQKLTY